MTLGRLNHVGVETPSIAASIETYRNLLGATAIGVPFDLPALTHSVIPAQAGIHLATSACGTMDSRLRGNDGKGVGL